MLACNSNVHKHENYDECTLILYAVYQGGRRFAHENGKTPTAHIGFFSDEQNPPSNHFDALKHDYLYFCTILRSSKYIKNTLT